MFKEDLLEGSEKIQFNILKNLFINKGKMNRSDLCDKLGISLPTLKSHVEKIDHLFRTDYKAKISIYYTKDFIFLKCKDEIRLKSLIFSYLDNSPKYKILNYFFLNSNGKLTGVKLSENFNISLATLNRKIIECNQILKEFDISIKNYELTGSLMQISYFYYLFFWNTEVDIPNIRLSDYSLITIIEKTLRISLSIKQKHSLYLWLKILMVRKKFFSSDFLEDSFTKSNLNLFKETEIFKELKLFFKKDSLNKGSTTYLAYSTLCFILSFNIVPYDFINKNKYIINSCPFKIFSLVIDEIENIYLKVPENLSEELKLNILNLCFRNYYFKGVFYSNNKVITRYYLNDFKSSFKDDFTDKLYLKITNLFDFKYTIDKTYFKLCIILTLNYLDGISKYHIRIGVLSMAENLIINSTIDYLKSFLSKKFNVLVEIYDENRTENYDLVITNFNIDFIPKNYDHIYTFTNLTIMYDLNNVVNLISEIEESKLKNRQ